MHNEVQQTRWDRLIRRVSGSIGPGSRVSETLSELFPVLDVESVPGELLALMGTRLSIGTSAIVGAAGESGRIQVFNPEGSANLITISRAYVTVSTTQTVRWAVSETELATSIGLQAFRDSRFLLPARPLGQIRRQSSAALTLAQGEITIPANDPFMLDDPNGVAVLAPGTGFEIGSTANATTIRVTFYWRERQAEESELQF